MKTMTTTKTTFSTIAAILTSALILSACATRDEDPLEGYNRGMYQVNTFLDKGLFRPIAKGYRYITPNGVRSRIGNVSDNLREPVNMVNSFLQGDFDQGMVSFWRFVINTTVGIGGMNDVAASAGLKERREDFGQTLGAWGVGSGPYIVLPIIGPSNGRDTVGLVADWFTSPWTYALDEDERLWLAAGQGLVERERLINPMDDIYETSLDPYATFRSVYGQYRDAAIANTRDNSAYSKAKSE
jgi:phospholipid-binding lipoprotein MlaA